jgi:hypothetical protein
MAALNPGDLTWAVFTAPGKAHNHSGEQWSLLPEGSVLTVNISVPRHAEKYLIASNQWVTAGSTVVEFTQRTIPGPQVLRPDGRLFVGGHAEVFGFGGGGPGHTATYTPGPSAASSGSWAAGPDFYTYDTSYGAQTASLLPNGNVFVGIVGGWSGLNGGSTLVLPTGQILLGQSSDEVQVYTPAGGADPAWRPTITSAPASVEKGETFPIFGTQFNGLSQGSSGPATNYPLVRITNRTSGHVTYCRTHDHSTMGVATGTAIVSTSFDVPAGIEGGNSDIEVVANGIASAKWPVAVAPGPASITSPAPESTITSPQTFQWTPGSGVTQYVLWIGTTGPGSNEVAVLDRGTNLSATVTGLRTNGGTVYVRLWSLLGTWQFRDYTYAAANLAQVTLPAPGSGLTNSTVTFEWSGVPSATQYYLWVGNSPGANDLASQDGGTGLTGVVTGLPVDGRTLYVRLWSLIGFWQCNDYTYTAANPAAMTSPTQGATLPPGTVTFQWTAGTAATQYFLWVGTAGVGSKDLDILDGGTNLAATVTNLPASGGATIYVRLWSLINGTWLPRDYTYSAAALASTAGRTLP